MHIKVFKLPVRNSISIYFPIIFVFTANQCHWLHNTKLRLLYHFLLSLNCNLNQAQGMIVHKSHFGLSWKAGQIGPQGSFFLLFFSRFLALACREWWTYSWILCTQLVLGSANTALWHCKTDTYEKSGVCKSAHAWGKLTFCSFLLHFKYYF